MVALLTSLAETNKKNKETIVLFELYDSYDTEATKSHLALPRWGEIMHLEPRHWLNSEYITRVTNPFHLPSLKYEQRNTGSDVALANELDRNSTRSIFGRRESRDCGIAP